MKKIAFLYVLLWLCTTYAVADPPPLAKELYQRCVGCHGSQGEVKALGKSALLKGQSADAIYNMLYGYAKGTKNINGMGTLMKGQVAGLSKFEMLTLAAYIEGFSGGNETKVIDSMGNYLVVTYPKYVKPNDEFFIKVGLTNEAAHVKAGGITLSFPQYTELDGYVVSTDFAKVKEYNPPQKIYNRISESEKPVRYTVLEGWEKSWPAESNRYLKVKLRFPQKDPLVLNLRAILIENLKNIIVIPQNNRLLDQQGYPVEEITIYPTTIE